MEAAGWLKAMLCRGAAVGSHGPGPSRRPFGGKNLTPDYNPRLAPAGCRALGELPSPSLNSLIYKMETKTVPPTSSMDAQLLGQNGGWEEAWLRWWQLQGRVAGERLWGTISAMAGCWHQELGGSLSILL